jgi:hypothetical protein
MNPQTMSKQRKLVPIAAAVDVIAMFLPEQFFSMEILVEEA